MPEDSVNLWSWSTFSFIEPLFKVSNSRTVNDEDVWTLSPFFMHKTIFTKYLQYISEWVPTSQKLSTSLTAHQPSKAFPDTLPASVELA